MLFRPLPVVRTPGRHHCPSDWSVTPLEVPLWVQTINLNQCPVSASPGSSRGRTRPGIAKHGGSRLPGARIREYEAREGAGWEGPKRTSRSERYDQWDEKSRAWLSSREMEGTAGAEA